MIYQLYKPNSKNTGFAMSISVNPDMRDSYSKGEPVLFMKIIKQSGWNNNSKTGSFSGSIDDDTKNVCVKLSEHEIGEIILALNKGCSCDFYHKNKNGVTTIALKKDITEYRGKKSIRISLYVTKNSNLKFYLPIAQGEITSLSKCLEEYLSSLYRFRISKDMTYKLNK